MTSQILTIRWILDSVHAKNLKAILLFIDFSKTFDSLHRGKMEQILRTYDFPKETIAAIMMLYKNMKAKVRSLDGDTDYFNIVAGVLQGDTLAPYLFITCLDYVLRTSTDLMKDNGFKLAKESSRKHPTQTITDANYTNDRAFLANSPTQAKSLLHSLEWAIGLYAVKTEYMCFNQRGDTSTLKGDPLKLVEAVSYQPGMTSTCD